MDAEVTLEVAKLPHLLLTDFALENVSVHAACLLANVVLADAEAADVSFRLNPLVIEDRGRPLGLLGVSRVDLYFFLLWRVLIVVFH